MSRLDELLSKEMTRQQFLAAIGLGIVSLFGLSTIMGLVTNSGSDSKAGSSGGYGYGSRHYGQ